MDRRLLLGGLAGVAGLAAMAQFAKAGPLTPPVGAVASTGKTLAEVEPRIPLSITTAPPGSTAANFVISQPGSYYLTGNLTGQASRNGIVIRASNVTLDRCGFTLLGGAGGTDAIVVEGANRTGITITNGHINGWNASGVALFGGARNIRISHITATNNVGSGIFAQTAAMVTNCIAASNGAGFDVTNFAYVSQCIAHSNATDGFRLQSRCHIFDNLSVNNNGTGFFVDGQSVGANRFEGNTSMQNLIRGYSAVSTANIFLRNVASGNTTNWVIGAGNCIQVLAAATTSGFAGSSGGSPMAPAGYDPNANFSF